MDKKAKDYAKTLSPDSNNPAIYIDLAKSSATKHMFEIKVYTEEQDPDYGQAEASFRKIPAIPVISKHDGSVCPIQDYSFTLRSISDRKISILRIYAEEPVNTVDLQKKCTNWFTVEYTSKSELLARTEQKRAKLVQEAESMGSDIASLKEDLGIASD